MKAVAILPNERRVTLVDHPDPVLESPTQVRLRSLETGLCGTDREICSFHYGTAPPGSDRLVIGHELLAEVTETGSEVSTLRPGDLVVPTVRRPCPHDHCIACRTGRQDFCYTGDFVERGIKEAHGYMGEFVVEEERHLVPVPRDLRDTAVLVEPLTIAEKALIQLRDVQHRLPWTCPVASRELGIEHRCHRALVLGAGPVGLLGAMALRAAGFQTWVYSRERAPSPKSEIVKAIGAEYVSSGEVPCPP